MKKNEKISDFRSDTVTRPTAAMRRAMAEAEVGDDVYGEDPTVNRLQERVAEMLGKESAIFMPTGTMANQAALKAATQPGDEVICDRNCHILNFEAGAPAALSGLMMNAIEAPRGILAPEEVEAAVRPDNVHCPRTRVVELEVTHNRGGGSIYPIETVRAIAAVARRHGLWMHLDGARLWNASVATGIPPSVWADEFDAVITLGLIGASSFAFDIAEVTNEIAPHVVDEEVLERFNGIKDVFENSLRADIVRLTKQYGKPVVNVSLDKRHNKVILDAGDGEHGEAERFLGLGGDAEVVDRCNPGAG